MDGVLRIRMGTGSGTKTPPPPPPGGSTGLPAGLQVTVFDAAAKPKTIRLSQAKPVLTFGRADDNDIVLTSKLVSRHHGRLVCQYGKWYIEDLGSTNGLIFNNANIRRKELGDGEFVRIDDGVETVANGVLFLFAPSDSPNKWYSLPITGMSEITIGRDPGCNVLLSHMSVQKHHAVIRRESDGFYIYDGGTVFINGRRIYGKTLLHEKDVITISNSKLIFTAAAVFFCCFRSGISVDTADVVIERGKKGKRFVTCNQVSLNIKPGELVAIIGGSGAGKSTLLNAMCGYLKPARGQVYINGINLYENYDCLRDLIGYVPQSDIVYDNLTLRDMLLYTAKMRLPKDISDVERDAAIDRAIAMVELTEKKNAFIKALSGGQRKRASIAVELLSDPNLLYLDEPASGLDPGTERNLMQSLRAMANNGKTVILVTHSTLQLEMCDKVVFMGAGGNLCFCGSHDEALKFFGVDSVVDVYNMITYNAKHWRAEYAKTVSPTGPVRDPAQKITKSKIHHVHQFKVLCSRYLKLVMNDRQRLLLLFVQAPVLGILISLVANEDAFAVGTPTKSILFALTCAAFWIGILNAIQEICKEHSILRREYMTGLSLPGYVLSKVTVLGLMCLIQTLIVVAVFAIGVGIKASPDFLDVPLLLPMILEMWITVLLTALAAAAMGLFVSALFDNPDKAMTVAPILLMPQILFSGVIFKLEGATDVISWIVACRWGMMGLGTTADLNNFEDIQSGIAMNPDFNHVEEMFTHEIGHLLGVWGILILFVVGFLTLAGIMLKKVGNTKS